jgi:chromosome segregation ATPase
MIKGIKTLEDIDGVLHTVRNEIARIDQEIDTLFERSQENKQQQSGTTEALAKIYFNEIEKKDVSKSASTIGMDVHELLEKRAVVYSKLLEDIKNNNTQLTLLESKRMQEHQLLNTAAKDVIEKEHEVQSVLEKDKEYQAQLSKTRASKKIANEAENKAVEAEQTRIEKGYPYEENVLFSYLWREKYGTPEYEGKRLIKFLDGWVASLSEYEKYRVNYWTLLEIPKRLRLHAEDEKKVYNNDLTTLSKIEHTHAEKMELGTLQEKEKMRQETVDQIDDEIAALEKTLESITDERQKHLEDRDAYAIEIIGKINRLLQQMSLPELHGLVKQTINKKDDRLVEKLNALKNAAMKMQEDIDENRKRYNEKLKQLHEVERLRVKFKSSRYDDIRSGFGNENVIQDMLGGLLGGLAQSDILWDTLRRSQRHVDTGSWPDFGSGGFSSGNSPWHFPKSRDGGSMFNLPDLGGFTSRNASDSFSTGGGF